MVLAVSAAASISTTAADGSTLPGVLISVSGITPAAAARNMRYWRQLATGEWIELEVIPVSAGATTETVQDWTCPTGVLDPSSPSTPYAYGVSVRTISTGIFTFASGVLSTPTCDRPGDLPWLIHPTEPERSLPVTLESDTGRTRDPAGGLSYPYGAASPIASVPGVRRLRSGRLVLNVPRTLRLELAVLLGDGRPLYLAQECGQAATDDGLLFLEDPSDDVIAGTVLRVESAYQQVYPGRISPPSFTAGSASEWWQ